ncbi:MAG: FtsX-like permease family protein, partial [Pseudomonadota bacterium]
GATSFRDEDNIIIVPYLTAMYRLLGRRYFSYLEIEVESPEYMVQTRDALEKYVIEHYNIPVSLQDEAFSIRNMAEIQNAMSETSKVMSMLLAVIAAVSLIVGGIGIMNIMLVSVTERTKEIGLRKAVGARKRDILSQFITEAGVIGIFGGVIGIILGVGATLIMSELAGWTTYISLSSVLLSFLFSVTVGVIFGIWPAQKASRLNPIEALRHE